MKGSPKVVGALEDVLSAELAAISTYFVHAKLCANWGYDRLAKKAYDESMDEMRHAEALVDRIVYFDGVPNLNKMGRIRAGATVPEQLDISLALETGQVERLVGAITVCRSESDDGTRLIFEPMVRAGEDTIDWIETQQAAIAALGEANYLAQQLHHSE